MEAQVYVVRGIVLEEKQVFSWTYETSLRYEKLNPDGTWSKENKTEIVTDPVYFEKGELRCATNGGFMRSYGVNITPDFLEHHEKTIQIVPSDHYLSRKKIKADYPYEMAPLQPHARLYTMAVPAKGLPVVFVPEKDRISAMRNDVIDHSCRGEFTFLHALDAQRMLSQESCSGISPFTVISALSRISAQMIRRIIRMIIAINTMITQIRVSGEPAGAFRASRHTAPQMKSSPRSS